MDLRKWYVILISCLCVCVVISLSPPHRRCLMSGDRYCVHLMSLCRRPSGTLSSFCPPSCPQNSITKASSKTLFCNLVMKKEDCSLFTNYSSFIKCSQQVWPWGNGSICACFRLWFDELMNLWVSVQNLPAWEGVSTSHSWIHLLSAKYYFTIGFQSSVCTCRI